MSLRSAGAGEHLAQLVVQLCLKQTHGIVHHRWIMRDRLVLQERRHLAHALGLQSVQTPQHLPGRTDLVEARVVLQRTIEREFGQLGIDARGQFHVLQQGRGGLRLALRHVQHGFGQVELSLADLDQQAAREPAPGDVHEGAIRGKRGRQLLLQLPHRVPRRCRPGRRPQLRSRDRVLRSARGCASPAANICCAPFSSSTVMTSNAPTSGLTPGRLESTLPASSPGRGRPVRSPAAYVSRGR